MTSACPTHNKHKCFDCIYHHHHHHHHPGVILSVLGATLTVRRGIQNHSVGGRQEKSEHTQQPNLSINVTSNGKSSLTLLCIHLGIPIAFFFFYNSVAVLNILCDYLKYVFFQLEGKLLKSRDGLYASWYYPPVSNKMPE